MFVCIDQEYANFADLQTFFQKYRTDAVGSSFTVVQINGGGNDQSNPGVEANLDIQYTTGMWSMPCSAMEIVLIRVSGISYPTPHIYYSTGGSPPYIPDSNTPTDTNEPCDAPGI